MKLPTKAGHLVVAVDLIECLSNNYTQELELCLFTAAQPGLKVTFVLYVRGFFKIVKLSYSIKKMLVEKKLLPEELREINVENDRLMKIGIKTI